MVPKLLEEQIRRLPQQFFRLPIGNTSRSFIWLNFLQSRLVQAFLPNLIAHSRLYVIVKADGRENNQPSKYSSVTTNSTLLLQSLIKNLICVD